MIKATHHFPSGFLWGTATSSHQVEGDNTNNDWWAWEQEPGRIYGGHKSAKACDWWGGRWKQDFDLAAGAGQNAHRLSIEWSRIEPSPAIWDEEALDAYRQILQGAVERGLRPMVSLHHFTNPMWVAEMGGWSNPEIVRLFERYSAKVVKALHDLVDLWVTINEPNVLTYSSYIQGEWPPGVKNIGEMPRVTRNLVAAHAAAYHVIHAIQPTGMVGLAHHYRGFKPLNPQNPLHRWVARFKHMMFNEVFVRACLDGRIRILHWRALVKEAKATQDFIGVNYYTTERASFDPFHPGSAFETGSFATDADLSPGAFIANEPQGFWEALHWAHDFKLPVYITENGVEDADDHFRPRYLAAHIRQLWRAVNYNWPVRGYFHWSLVDNFEWERGWSQRYGLWGLDVETQKRVKRPSADFYAQICRANGLPSEAVAQYAPEIMDDLFPPRGPAELTANG